MIAKCLTVAFGAFTERSLVGVDGEAHDVLVPVPNEVTRCNRAACDVVCEHVVLGVEIEIRGDSLHEHDRNTLVVYKGDLFRGDVGIYNDEPVHLPAVEQVPDAVLVVGIVAKLHDEVAILGLEGASNLVYEKGEVK